MNTITQFSLQCPVPKTTTARIQLGHGSGGWMTHRLLEDLVFPRFSNEKLEKKHDGALLPPMGAIAMSTDSYVVSPLFFPGGSIGDLAVNGTVNDLAMCGARAQYLSLALILEEGLPLETLTAVMDDIRAAATTAGVEIITGDTKVVEKGKGDQLFITTTGIGRLHSKADIDISRVKIGDRLIISGPLARHGITIMSRRKGLDFESQLCSDTRPLGSIVEQLLNHFGSDIHFLRDPTRGGLATTLNEICQPSRFGISVDENALPVDEEVNGACEMLGLDPLFVANEGIFLSVVSAAIAEEYLAMLRNWEFGGEASLIGEIVSQHPGEVVMGNSYGGHRVLRMLAGEQLPRIC